MDLELIILGGYGKFVWTAFFFTFGSCIVLYLRIKKEFKKQEKIFLKEFDQKPFVKIKIIKQKNAPDQVLSGGKIF